ncbi:unnamed protein product [Lactuca virosa]|uniref:Pentatricopeptide repeat-containing protein n=1 Tax=Lactuca virosa TaxID=75947 RepID=A0AAU9MM58_9ASTR|nr:unnamed protein product [Lactuca virosa]
MLSSPAPSLFSSAPAVTLMLTQVESNTNRRLNTSTKPPTLPKTRKRTNPSPPPDVDLMGLCKNGSVKETIELMSQGVPVGSDVFELVLDSCDDLELGKKVQQLLIRSPYYACASINSIQECFKHFKSIKNDYNLDPEIDHYLGVIDVLGKSGHLNEAFEFIENIPFEPTCEIWESLMNSAQIHGDIELEDRAMTFLQPSITLHKLPLLNQSVSNMLKGKKNKVYEYRNLEQ